MVLVMSIKKSLAIAASLFLMASGLDAAAANPVVEVTKLLTAVRADNYDSSVAVAARAEFIKLTDEQLKTILGNDPKDIFRTPYGFSLIHGWMLNKLNSHDLPFYINQKFSVNKYIQSIIDKMSDANVKNKIFNKWSSARFEIEANRWDYYKHMQYIPAAIAQAGTVAGAILAPDNKAYVLTLQKTDFRGHIDSIIGGGIPADVAHAQAQLENIMIGLLNHYDLDSLLPPADRDLEDLNIGKFVEFVVEHVPALYRAPEVRDVTLEQVYRGQTGEQLRIFVARLIRVGSPAVAAGSVRAAIEFVRQHQSVIHPIDPTKVSPSLVPIYYGAEVAAVGAAAAADPAAGAAAPAAAACLNVTPFSPRTPLGAGLVIANSGVSVAKMQNVYPTPMMKRWVNAAEARGQLATDNIKADEAADILKYFASYLIKVKDATKDALKGPYTGSGWGQGYTFLSEVLAMRYKLLANPGTLPDAIDFINQRSHSFLNSLQSQGIATPTGTTREVGDSVNDEIDRLIPGSHSP